MIISATILLIQIWSTVRSEDPIGHNKPLGSHKSPLGVTLAGKFSSPGVFYEYFVKDSQPLLLKSPLLDTPFPAFKTWTDDFLREEYGREIVSVEQSKKEKRGVPPSRITLHEFLDEYQKKNIYMVQSLPEKMKDDVHLPVTLQCGGFQHALVDVVIWMSSGGTKSVLHQDKLDNLLCVLNGTKDVLLIDQVYKADVEADGFVKEGTYSKIDVDSVNLKQYPRLKKVPWHRAHLEAGDCIFIPYRWYHQINSSGGEENRNLAVNYWFSHLWWHNTTDCKDFESFNVTEPLTKFPFSSTNEQIRSQILEPFSDLDNVSKEDFVSAFLAKPSQVEELYHFIVKKTKTKLSWEDLYSFNIDEAVLKFPEVFAEGVKTSKRKKKKKDEKKVIWVQTNDEVEPENVVKVPMIDPNSDEFEKLLADVVNQGDFVDNRKKEDKPHIQDINIKVTKGQQKPEEQEAKKEDKKNEKEKSTPKHDEF